MIVKTRDVYYCEWCKRHRLTRSAIEKHEPRCIYNPERASCGWHEPHITIPRPADYVPQLKEDLDVDLLRTWADGCPACMLSVVVQANLSTVDREDLGFDYQQEVERFRLEEQDDRPF